MTSLFTLKCDSIEGATFIGFRGKEEVSRPYEFEIFFSVPAGTSVRSAVGQRATIRADRGLEKGPMAIHGVLANVRLLHQASGRAVYGALLVPRLWLLRHFWRSYVFTGKSLREFLTETLEDGGLVGGEFRFTTDDSLHAQEEFVAQYRETHLDFLHRWLEREGVYYYFEHDPDGDHEVVVFTEEKAQAEDFPGGGRVRYLPLLAEEQTYTGGEALHQITADVRWLPRSVTLADYDYAHPAVPLRSDSDVTKSGIGAITEYGYRVFDEKGVKRMAQVKAQSIGCREVTLRASGDALGPRAGYRFTIDDRPEDLEETWLAIEVEMSGSVAGFTPEVARLTGLSTKDVFRMKTFAVPASVQYRAPQSTPWPRIYGFENGVVCGDADSPYAQLDADGRYLVRFEFDTSDLPDGKVSTRVRMLQPHGGGKEGFHFPLRKGTEVMIAFLGGDPDRPFIAGVVPNAHKPSVVGERNNTQNIIRTGSNNQLVMEDEQGKEFIFLHSPNNMTGIYMGHPAGRHGSVYTGDGEEDVQLFTSPSMANPAAPAMMEGVEVSLYPHTNGDAGSFIGGTSWQEVGGAENIFVKGAVAHGYRSTYDLKVGEAATENYYATRTTTVKSGRTDTVEAGGWTQNITDMLHQTVTGSGWQHVTAAWKHDVDAENHDEYGSWKTDVAGAWNASFAEGSVTMNATPASLTAHSSGVIEMTADGSIKIEAPSVSVNSTGFLKHYLSVKHEFYAYKGATGIAKTDHAAIYQSTYGFKADQCGLKLDTCGIKVENEGCKKLTFGMYLRAFAFAKKTGAIDLRDIPAEVWNGAFKKT